MAEDWGFIKPTYSFRAHPEHSKGNRVYGAEDDDDDDDDDQPVVQYDIKIDESLLIDIESLYIGVMISEGGHSVVYEGLYKTMPVAIKILQPDKASSVSPDRKEKFLREIVMLSRVKHDNLVMFIGASIEPTMLIVTELMRGGSLKKFLWSIRPRCLDLQLSISFALNISRVMECLHGNGIIHRDLKPDNLLLTEDQKKLKLADFGLAREETLVEMMTAEAGTYRWMAPELFSTVPLPVGKKKHYDHKVDVYSFSMVLWELLTNCTPFKGMSSIQAAYAAAQNRRPSVENLPKDIIPLLESCWADDPAHRPEFTEITNALSDLLNTPSSPQTRAPQVVGIEHQKHNLAADSPGTRHLMDESKGMRSKKLLKSSSVKFLRNCFGR